MDIFSKEMVIESCEKTDIIDVTGHVRKFVAECGVRNGIANLFTAHTTTAIRINENEDGLMLDMKRFLEENVPAFRDYTHDDMARRPHVPEDEPVNAHSHLKSLMLGASESVPIIGSSIMLGRWQSIFFIDLDGPRKRKMYIQIMGER